MKVSVIGSGSWGCALAMVLAKNGNDVFIYSRNENQIEDINKNNRNEKYLPNVKFNENIKASNDFAEVLDNSKLIVLAVPTQQVRNVLLEMKGFIKLGQIIVDVAKGIEVKTGLRISEICEEILPDNPYSVLSGPSHAEEVSREIPTTVVVSSKDNSISEIVRDYFMNENFRIYINSDLIGVELAGALKNIIAFGAGVLDGMGYGDNSKSALITRGLNEIVKFGTSYGAKKSTFYGLSGIGDLVVTCTSKHSRNWRAGNLIGSGLSINETLNKINMVVEGITTTEIVYRISKERNIEMPITKAIHSALYENLDAKLAVNKLMTREKKNEFEEIYE